MKNTNATIRTLALGAAAAIVTTLFSAIVANMPPEFGAAPGEARNGRGSPSPIEVAIVPSRIEVFGVRSQDTAASDVQSPAGSPRS